MNKNFYLKKNNINAFQKKNQFFFFCRNLIFPLGSFLRMMNCFDSDTTATQSRDLFETKEQRKRKLERRIKKRKHQKRNDRHHQKEQPLEKLPQIQSTVQKFIQLLKEDDKKYNYDDDDEESKEESSFDYQ